MFQRKTKNSWLIKAEGLVNAASSKSILKATSEQLALPSSRDLFFKQDEAAVFIKKKFVHLSSPGTGIDAVWNKLTNHRDVPTTLERVRI